MFVAPGVIHVERARNARCCVTCSRLEEDAGRCAAGSARTHGSTGDERELMASTGDFFGSTSFFAAKQSTREFTGVQVHIVVTCMSICKVPFVA